MRSILRVLAILIVLSLMVGCAPATNNDYDVMIKGGNIYDGTTNPPFIGDIGVKGDKIVAIGKLNGKAKEVIDATGYIVTPGFIDCHNHTDVSYQVLGKVAFLAPFLADWKGNYNYISQGVTTVVSGNCGMGSTDTSVWMEKFKSLGGFGTNIYHLIPYEAVKSEIIGTDQRPVTAQEFELVKKRMAEEMKKGAVGFSTGLELAPAVYDTTDELVEVAKVVKQYGGIYASHIRNQIGVVDAVKEAIEIGRRSGIPVQYSHIGITRIFIDPQLVLDLIEAARKEGIDITADQYPYDTGTQRIQYLLDTKYLTGEQVRNEYKTPQGKIELKKGIEKVLATVKPDAILVTSCETQKNYEGKTLKQIAELEKKPAADSYVELACMEKPPYCVFFYGDMNIVRKFMQQSWVFTSSDGALCPKSLSAFSGKFHPRFYGNFPHKIKQFVIDEKLIDLQFAIRSMTSLPAEKFGMKYRGKLAEGYYADIAVIDLNTIADKGTYENPFEYSTGIIDLLVNGVVEIQKGNFTSKVGGRPCVKD